jgi:hypothetical protein
VEKEMKDCGMSWKNHPHKRQLGSCGSLIFYIGTKMITFLKSKLGRSTKIVPFVYL